MTTLWVWETAAAFWGAAGGPEGFPRELRGAIARALPVTIVLLPRLRVAGVDAWLRERGVACGPALADRPLRACLVARYGQGFIFVEGADPPDEQRFSLAHELAHFLRDYWQPRQAVAARLGPAALAALDDERPPTRGERIAGILAHVEPGLHRHLLDRGPASRERPATVEVAERDADLLAFELLAPARRALAGREAGPPASRRAAMVRLLVAEFGLPPGPAARYAALLVPPDPGPEPLLQRLGLVHRDGG